MPTPKAAGGLKSVQPAGEGCHSKTKPQDPPVDKADDSKKDTIPKEPFAEPAGDEDAMADHEQGSSIPDVEKSTMKTLFLGGGAYCFQRHMQFAYPGTGVDVAEIDRAVTEANFKATGPAQRHAHPAPPGATPASSSSSTRTTSSTTWSSATPSTISPCPGT